MFLQVVDTEKEMKTSILVSGGFKREVAFDRMQQSEDNFHNFPSIERIPMYTNGGEPGKNIGFNVVLILSSINYIYRDPPSLPPPTPFHSFRARDLSLYELTRVSRANVIFVAPILCIAQIILHSHCGSQLYHTRESVGFFTIKSKSISIPPPPLPAQHAARLYKDTLNTNRD